jgi:hypothetical protein
MFHPEIVRFIFLDFHAFPAAQIQPFQELEVFFFGVLLVENAKALTAQVHAPETVGAAETGTRKPRIHA